MPGRDKLARELGVHGSTIERALKLLDDEGLVRNLGPGKPRQIVRTSDSGSAVTTVCVLLYDAGDQADDYILNLQHHLGVAGHMLTFAPRTMLELKFNPSRIERMVKKESADAWIVYSGSQPVLERFVRLSIPTFSLFGRMNDLPIAGSGADIQPALAELVHELRGLGHSRIVMMTRSQFVEGGLGLTEKSFIRELKKNNLPVSTYNLAVWDNTPSGLANCLDRLFKVNPPTALLVDDWTIYHAVEHHLLRDQGVDGRDVLCVSMDPNPSFAWQQPEPVHFYWDPQAVVQPACEWLKSIAAGKVNVTQTMIRAELRGLATLARMK